MKDWDNGATSHEPRSTKVPPQTTRSDKRPAGEGAWPPANLSVSDFCLQNCRWRHSCCVRLPGVRHFARQP